MEKSSEISFAGILVRNFSGEMPANERATQRVFPERNRIDATEIFGQQVEYATVPLEQKRPAMIQVARELTRQAEV